MRGGGLAVESVSFDRRGARGSVRVLDSVSFALEPARLLAIVGPSGAGKSTLIKTMMAEFPGYVARLPQNTDVVLTRACGYRVFGFSVSHTTRQPRTGEVDGNGAPRFARSCVCS